MNNVFKSIILVLIILFLSLYLGKYLNVYNENRNVLTDEAIARFEKDLKENKDINPRDYLPKEKNYNNKASQLGMSSSKTIEKGFKKVLKYFLSYLEDY